MLGLPTEALTEVLVDWGPPGLIVVLLLAAWVMAMRYVVRANKENMTAMREAHSAERERVRMDHQKEREKLFELFVSKGADDA